MELVLQRSDRVVGGDFPEWRLAAWLACRGGARSEELLSEARSPQAVEAF